MLNCVVQSVAAHMDRIKANPTLHKVKERVQERDWFADGPVHVRLDPSIPAYMCHVCDSSMQIIYARTVPKIK